MIIAKYKYDSSVYADFVPVFNDGYTGYTVSDEVDGNMTTRTIECDTLPTLMKFGNESATDSRTDSLLEVLDMDTSGLTNCDNMFRYNKNLTSITCEWNTTNVTTMRSMFAECQSLTSLDVSNFNTSNVNNMGYMFYNCNNLTSLDVSNFDTSKVTDMQYMFRDCVNLTSLDVSNFNTSNVTSINGMFYNCNKITSLDVSNFNTSNVNNMGYMFYNCYLLTSLDLSNFNTSNVNNMYAMFHNCQSLTSLDISNFDTSKVTDMSYMFYRCYKLTSLDVSNFNTSNVTSMSNMFTDTPLLTDIGMVYCNPSTVSKLSSALNTQARNVYVECDPLCYDKYQYITYMQYKEDKKTLLYLDNETNTWKKPVLREWDSIEKHSDGKYYYHKRSGEIVLNGSEGWVIRPMENTVKTQGFGLSYSNAGYNYTGTIITCKCSGFCTTLNSNYAWSADEEIFYINDYIHVRVSRSKLVSQDVTGFKQWLQANPVTAVYQLVEEKIYECISLDIMSHFNTTNLEINSGVIIPKTTLRLQESVPNVVKELQEKVSMLENELVLLKTDEMLSDIQDIINE